MEYKFTNFEEMMREINRFFYAEFGKKGNISIILDDDYYDTGKMQSLMYEFMSYRLMKPNEKKRYAFSDQLLFNFPYGSVLVTGARALHSAITSEITNMVEEILYENKRKN